MNITHMYTFDTGVVKHYEWLLYIGHRWLPIENDHVIEAHYCQPGAKGITLHTKSGSVWLDSIWAQY